MSKIIAVHSYRGGTGKSNFVANVATLMAKQGYRVGVVDTDVQSPGIHNIFDLTKDQVYKTLNDYLWGQASVAQIGYNVGQKFCHDATGSLTLVPASINPDDIARILSDGYSVQQLNTGLSELIRHFDLQYLLIDTHPGLSRETFFSIAISKLLILLLRPDRQDYQGTAVVADLARQLLVPEMMLVVNKTLAAVDRDDFAAQLQDTYRTPVGGILPMTEDLMALGSNGIFCEEYPDHPWTTALIQVTQRILQGSAGAVT